MKILKGLAITAFGFLLGMCTTYYLFNDNTVSINGQRVTVVDFMYTYQTEEGDIIEGDYSIVSDKGYEYNPFTSYSKEYENAKINK